MKDFILGIGSCINIFGNEIQIPLSDYEAIESDWKVIGNDLRNVINSEI